MANSEIKAVRGVVAQDAEQSANKWDAALAEDKRWAGKAEECSEAYDAALDALDAGDLDMAESALERANSLESEGGDNCDAHHALQAVRALMA
jgi:hypothetical protein